MIKKIKNMENRVRDIQTNVRRSVTATRHNRRDLCQRGPREDKKAE